MVRPPTQAPTSPTEPTPLGPAVTASDVAQKLSIALPIAKEQLLLAEARGVLCRDDGPEGLRFFRNFFADPGLSAAA